MSTSSTVEAPATTLQAAIYTRVSSDEQAQEGTSLETQRQGCLNRAQAEGWEVTDVFTDPGISGAKGAADRPGLAAMLKAAQAGTFQVLLVTKTDRLGRSTRLLENLWGDLEDAGVTVVPILEPQYDGRTPYGKMFRTMLAGIAQMERDVIRERTHSGRLARIREGGWSGGEPPFGFRVEGKGKDSRLVLHDQEAVLVRYAVSLLLDKGMGPLAVCEALNAEGFTPRKAPRWTLTGLRTMLVRGPWGGVWTYGKPASRTKQEPVQVPIPRMLEPERHAALLEYLKATSQPRRPGPVHPLSGLLIGACGHPYHGLARRDRGNRRYRCRYGKDVGRGWTCDAPTVLADVLDDQVWAQVLTFLADPEALRAAAEDHLGILAGAAGVEADALARAQAQVVKVQQALTNAFTAGLKAGLPEEVIQASVTDLKADLAAAEAHVTAIAAMAASTQAQAAQVQTIQAVADLAQSTLREADAETRAKVFRLLGVKVALLEVAEGGSPARWSISGQAAHGRLLASLSPAHHGVLSLANRTSR